MIPFFPHQQPPQPQPQPPKEDHNPWNIPPFPGGTEIPLGPLSPPFPYPPHPHFQLPPWDPRNEPYLQPPNTLYPPQNFMPWDIPYNPYPIPPGPDAFKPHNNPMFPPWPMWVPFGHEGVALPVDESFGRQGGMTRTKVENETSHFEKMGSQGIPFSGPYGGGGGYPPNNRESTSRTSQEQSRRVYGGEEDLKPHIPYESRTDRSRLSTPKVLEDYSSKWNHGSNLSGEPRTHDSNRTSTSHRDDESITYSGGEYPRHRTTTCRIFIRDIEDSGYSNNDQYSESRINQTRHSTSNGSNTPHGSEYQSPRSISQTRSHHHEDTFAGENSHFRSGYQNGRTDRNGPTSSQHPGEFRYSEREHVSNVPYGTETRTYHPTCQDSFRREEDSRRSFRNEQRYGDELQSDRNRRSPIRTYSSQEQDPRYMVFDGAGNSNHGSGSRTFSRREGSKPKESWYPSQKEEDRYPYPENYHQRHEYPPYPDYQRGSTHQEYQSVGNGSHDNEHSNFMTDYHDEYSNSPHSPPSRNRRERKSRRERRIRTLSHCGPEYVPSNTLWNRDRHPTEGYLVQANSEPCETIQPQKMLCILDLNGTLIHREGRGDWHTRPGCEELLDYLFENFRVMVWSSATKSNVQSMVKTVFSKEQANQLVAVWDRSSFNLPRELFNQKTLTLKDLQLVWDGLANSCASPLDGSEYDDRIRVQRDWDQSNTILIDDSMEKAALQPHNCVILKEFNRKVLYRGGDRELENVSKYLDKVRWQKDVSAYMRRYPYQSNSASPEIPDDRSDGIAVQDNMFHSYHF